MGAEDFYRILEEQQDWPISSRDAFLAGNTPEYRKKLEIYIKQVLDEYDSLKDKGVLDSVERKLTTEHSVKIERFGEDGDITRVFNSDGIEMYNVSSRNVYTTKDVIWDEGNPLNHIDFLYLKDILKVKRVRL